MRREDPTAGWMLGLLLLIGVFAVGFSLGWFWGWLIP